MVQHTPTSTLVFFVNGKKVVDSNVDPEWTLLYYLRNKLRLCGTKLGCAEGGCGACTVMVSKYDRNKKNIVHLAINACLAPVCALHGLAVTTVEGIGNVAEGKIHPVQERIAKSHGSQCGFCTPGFVMSMYTLLRSSPSKPTMEELEVAFQGNLCRCTGYRPIIEGFRTFTEEWENRQRLATNGCSSGPCGMGDQCCRNKPQNGTNGVDRNGESNGVENEEKLFEPSAFVPYDPSQEPIFPPELIMSEAYDSEYLKIEGPRASWHRPLTLEGLLDLKKKNPSAKIINGNTEVGVEVKFKNFLYPVLVIPNQIKELRDVTVTSEGVKVGAAVTLTEMEDALRQLIDTEKNHKTRIFSAIVDMLHWFAGKQIRNAGTVGGNIMTGSPISDLNPIFMSSHCQLELLSKDSPKRTVVMNENFWTGYRRNIVKNDEILVSILIPFTKENQYFKAYKQAKRRDDDIAIVNAAFNIELDGTKVRSAKMAYGGMAPTTVLAVKTAAALSNKDWNNEMLEEAYKQLMEELPLSPSAPGGMVPYRRALTLSLFFKFYLYLSDTLREAGHKIEIVSSHLSGKDQFHSLTPKSSQYFAIVPNGQDKTDAVGRNLVHQSAFKQATGEAIYCDDMPKYADECFLSVVPSTRAHAKILKVDPAPALALPGVIAFFSAKDISPERNKYGPIVQDEEVFASQKVTTQGQVIGAIVADDPVTARRASKLVQIEYEDLQPIIVSIEDAIKHNSYLLPTPKALKRGDAAKVLSSTPPHLRVEGEVRMGGQEHFYLETHATIAVPKKEDNEFEIICSTQNPSELQHMAAHLLGIPSNRVVGKVKRMGGGFGGKESKHSALALPVIFAASKLKRVVRAMFDRDEDMLISGHRHPFMGRYRVSFTPEGKITAAEVTLYNNGGHTLDLSGSVMDRAMLHFSNAFFVPDVAVYGYCCRTNTPSNTAFRGFGGPQGMFFGETIITHIAESLGEDIAKVSALNLYKEGDSTHYNQILEYCTLGRCWTECIDQSQYNLRKQKVDEFNRTERWRKRGISLVPTLFGVAYTSLFLNQGGALVLIYADGSVLISHGGTEMGQGLHTKMLQVTSRALGIPVELVHISETSTDKVPNTSPTAASVGSDLNGMAIIEACNVLNERLRPIKEANPKGGWKDWVKTAYFSRVSLAASGFHATPEIGYNFAENKGKAFGYHTYGVSCTEVEIDCLTGDHQVLRTDIVMDLGESLNPALDVGQVEGAFVQGQGLFTLEELIYSPKGDLYSRGPGAYKIPALADIPAEFNVSLLKGAPNPKAVYSSKAVGEPPLFLASSVFFAVREAVKASRLEAGLEGYFRFDSPATASRIRMACADPIADRFPTPGKDTVPWNVPI